MQLPAGYSVRPPRPEDAQAVLDAWNSDSLAWNGTATSTLDWLTAPWDAPGADLERDFGVITTGAGEVAAYFFVESDPPYERVAGLGGVAAAHHGRGLGAAILREIEVRAGWYADLAPGARDVTLVVGALADEPKASSLLTGLGYAEVRRFVSMEISFDRRPQPPAPVAGVELRELRSGEERAVHRCLTSAFEDHWGGALESEERWMQRHVHAESFDPALWRLAWRGQRLVGALVGASVAAQSPTYGYIELLGVVREERRHGIGEALLRSGLQAFAARGREGVLLIVDSESTTGATRLYERAGMTARPRFASWTKRLRSATPAATHNPPA